MSYMLQALKLLIGKVSEGRVIQKMEPKVVDLKIDPMFPIEFQMGKGRGGRVPQPWESGARRRLAGPTRSNLRLQSLPRRVK